MTAGRWRGPGGCFQSMRSCARPSVGDGVDGSSPEESFMKSQRLLVVITILNLLLLNVLAGSDARRGGGGRGAGAPWPCARNRG